MILSVDPGNKESAYALLDQDLRPLEFGKVENETLLDVIDNFARIDNKFVIEMVASYGMAVGKEVFETVFWIGRFWQEASNCGYGRGLTKIYRKDVKINLCNSMKAKDGNIRQALIDRFGVVGVKKNPGWFYGVSKDVWSAIAVGVTFADMNNLTVSVREG